MARAGSAAPGSIAEAAFLIDQQLGKYSICIW
jgi:hypothetical protein